MAEGTVWLYDVEGSYHDASCPCTRHCGNCFDDLDSYESTRDKPRVRYCSDYCRNFAKRDRAFGRRLSAITPRED